MEVTGILHTSFDTLKVSEKFSKREFVLETEVSTPYPQKILIQLTQDKCGLLDQFRKGDMLKVQINLRGREWNGPQGIKYFNTIEAWRIELVQGTMRSEPPAATQQSTTPAPVFNSNISDNDDLPF